MVSGVDLYAVILIFAIIVFGLAAIVYLLISMARAAKMPADPEESFEGIKVCADGTSSYVKLNFHDLTITNNTGAELRVTLDREEYLFEPSASYTGSFGQGHHRIYARNADTNELAKIGFTLRRPDTIVIEYEGGKLKFN